MEFLLDISSFFVKALIIVISIVAIFAVLGILKKKAKYEKEKDNGSFVIENLSEFYKETKSDILEEIVSDEELLKINLEQKLKNKNEKKEFKKLKKDFKNKSKNIKSLENEDINLNSKKNLIITLVFKGDIEASSVENLREEVTALLSIKKYISEVVVCLESPGGEVASYGLASSQLLRIRNAKIPLTICIDKVAASGGYLMAVVGDKILSAPFAYIGSIGVVGQIPNFYKAIDKLGIKMETHTAGEYKRTLTMFNENSDKERDKFKDDLNEIHTLFKNYVKENREIVDINEIATGEVWLGQDAIKRNLVDDIKTSDDYLFEKFQEKDAEIYKLKYVVKKNSMEKFRLFSSNLISTLDKKIIK